MASGFTNRGKKLLLNTYFAANTSDEPGAFKIALCTDANTPTADTNVLADLTEIAAGNGYTAGGLSLSRDNVDFDNISEDDTGDKASIQIKDVVWTASGGTLPGSGSGARWAVLLDDDATPNVIAWFDMTSARQVSDGQTLTLQDCEFRLT